MGPISVYALRAQLPDHPRSFRLPMVGVLSSAAFIAVCLMIYWTGWDTMLRLALPMAVGPAILAVKAARDPDLRGSLDLREASWLVPYFGGLLIISYIGNFGGGLGLIGSGWDLLTVAVFALAIFALAFKCRLSPDKARRYLAEEAVLKGDEDPAGASEND